MIERIEVVPRPQLIDVRHQRVFGVINVITKRGRDQGGAAIKASYGSNDTYKTSLSAGKRLPKRPGTFLAGTFYDSQGYNRLYYKEI